MAGFEVSSHSVNVDRYGLSGNSRAQSVSSDGFSQFMGAEELSVEGEKADVDPRDYGPVPVSSLGTRIKLADLIAENPFIERRFAELPEDEYEAYVQSEMDIIEQMKESLKHAHSQLVAPDQSQYPALQTYAGVVVDGQTVATVDNQGIYTTSVEIASNVNGLLPNEVGGEGGPALAQARIEIIASALGGTVVKAETALTQEQYRGLPEYQDDWVTDYTAMLADPAYQEIQQAIIRLDDNRNKRLEYLYGPS